MVRKVKKVEAILKNVPEQYRTLKSFDMYMSLSEQTIDMIIKDLKIDLNPVVPQLDLTMEMELLK